MASTVTVDSVAPMRQWQNLEFPYKHSTGETVGRFLAGLKEQKKIWGQRVAGQGVVVPPLGYSEVDASDAGEWVEVNQIGVVTAVARVDHPIDRLHLSTTPFAFVLVKLDGADTAMAHIVKDDLDRVSVGARVQVVWKGDDARIGSIRDIECFRVIADAVQPKPPRKAAAKKTPTKAKKVPAKAKKAPARRPRKAKMGAPARKTAKPVSTPKRTKTAKSAKKPKKTVRAKTVKAKTRTKARVTKKPRSTKARQATRKVTRKKKS